MEIVTDITQLNWENTAITIGKFDGVHTGHQMLVDKVLTAGNEGCIPVVFTFDRLPAQLLQQRTVVKNIFTEQEKQEYLSMCGIQRYIIFPFSKETAAMEPEQFILEILVKQLQVKKLYVGEDFRFGKGRKGDAVLLEKLSSQYGFSFEAVEKKLYLGEEVSSTRIRDSIYLGRMEEVSDMLGRPFYLGGKIIHGRSLGHTIGVPTINQSIQEGKIIPKTGVYCSQVTIEGKVYHGITNVGSKPTVQEEIIYGAETHLFDCDSNLYGKYAKTELLHFVREEQKFASIDELMQQMNQDIMLGRKYFS